MKLPFVIRYLMSVLSESFVYYKTDNLSNSKILAAQVSCNVMLYLVKHVTGREDLLKLRCIIPPNEKSDPREKCSRAIRKLGHQNARRTVARRYHTIVIAIFSF